MVCFWCLIIFLSVYSTIAQDDLIIPNCDPGYTSFGSSCYVYNADILSFKKASDMCFSKGGHLASITDEEENNFVAKLAKGERVWIGGKRNPQGNFRWTNGDKWNYISWRKREPNNWGNREECVETNFVRAGWWNDHFCDRLKPYVCEIDIL